MPGQPERVVPSFPPAAFLTGRIAILSDTAGILAGNNGPGRRRSLNLTMAAAIARSDGARRQPDLVICWWLPPT